MATTTKRKYHCEKCGRTFTSQRVRKSCPLLELVPPGLFRKPMYRCGGHVTRVVAPARPKNVDPAAKLAVAERNLKRSMTRLRRAATSVKMWQRRIARLEKLVAAAKVQAMVAGTPMASTRLARAIDLSDV